MRWWSWILAAVLLAQPIYYGALWATGPHCAVWQGDLGLFRINVIGAGYFEPFDDPLRDLLGEGAYVVPFGGALPFLEGTVDFREAAVCEAAQI